jgi:hypothetical protein
VRAERCASAFELWPSPAWLSSRVARIEKIATIALNATTATATNQNARPL